MLISELTVYDFLREKINLSDSDARRYARELFLSEKQLRNELKIDIGEEINRLDFATKKDIKDLEYSTKKDIKDLEIKIEKGFKEVIIWVVAAMVTIGGLSTAIIKVF